MDADKVSHLIRKSRHKPFLQKKKANIKYTIAFHQSKI